MRRRSMVVALLTVPLILPPWSGATTQEPAASPALTPVLAEFVGEVAIGRDALRAPAGVAVDAARTLYVIDAANNVVRIFAHDGTPIATWGERGTGPGQFAFSEGHTIWGDLALGSDGNLYVLDALNSRVQVITPDGTYVREWGGAGSAPGLFTDPKGIAIDRAGLIYIADGGNRRVQVFDDVGHVLATWGDSLLGGESLHDPTDVAIDAGGTVWVTDWVTQRVYRFATEDTDFTGVGERGVLSADFAMPIGAAVDAHGTLYVADFHGHQIQVFAPDGAPLGSIGSVGVQPGQFLGPRYLTVSPDGLLYVAEEGNRRVSIFRLLQPLTSPAGTAGSA